MSKPSRVGLGCALLLGGSHLIWVILVSMGLGQILCDFILWAHMIHLAITIGPFDPTASIALVLMTAVLGYVGGYVGSLAWNRMQ